MDKPTNFLEDGGITSLFARATRQAGSFGGLNAKPLMDALDRAFAVSNGIATVLRIRTANAVQADAYADRDEGQAIEPPLNEASVSALCDLARVSAQLLANELEHVARWTDEYGVSSALLKAASAAQAQRDLEAVHSAIRNADRWDSSVGGLT